MSQREQLDLFATVAKPGGSALEGLTQMQALLGQWHDLDLWLQRAREEPDLSPCVAEWARQRALRERQLWPLREALQRALA